MRADAITASADGPGVGLPDRESGCRFIARIGAIVPLELALQPGRQPRSDGRRKRSKRGRGEEPRRKASAVGPATASEATIFAFAE
jgi:hypothetical protein